MFMLRLRRLLTLSPFAIAGVLLVLDPAIARLLLPFREMMICLLSAQVVIATAAMWRAHRRGGGCASQAAVCTLSVVCFGIVFTREYPVRERTVAFTSNGARLVGTLYQGKTEGEHAAIVVVHGSGKFPRRLYRYWAQKFASLGFDVMVYDKRGVGDSGGAYEGENNTSSKNLRVLAEDASNAVNFVASLPGVTRHIGLFGVSQGGWVAPLAAQMNPRVKFLVLHSGPVVSVRQQNLYERLTGAAHSSSTAPLAEAEDRIRSSPPAGFDPRTVLASLDVTSLWLFGTADMNVPVQTSIGNLEQLIGSGKAFEYRVFPGADHLILTRDTRFSGLSDDYWTSVVDWMKRHEGRRLDARSIH